MAPIADVIPWPGEVGSSNSDFKQKVGNALAMLRAIDAGELLSALPECIVAKDQHITALTLLKLVERELSSINH